MKKKLYIGCALTRLPKKEEKDFLKMLADLKIGLKDHFEILEFKGVTGLAEDATPPEVYIWDINNCVKRADCMLAICDHPSLGLGYEIATAVEKQGIPVLALAHKDALVTKLIRGIDHKDFQFIYYSSVDEIISQTIKTLTK
ncbi:MAG: hypothetical protein KA515_01745 [Candidatus Pacebacteria bacterium]|nr:hypothetical protein [Candidatus Paceibacterota bacterium]